MDFTSFIGSAVVAACVSGVVSIVGMTISNRSARAIHTEKIALDRELAERKFKFDKELAELKFDFDKRLAESRFDRERAQLVHKRCFELAEALLSDAYRFRDLMRYVRNPFSFGNEGGSRKGDESETENLKHLKDSYFVPIERLQKQSEFVSGFMEKLYTVLSHF